MVFIPVPVTPPPPASPRVRQLSDELSTVIDDYQRRFPDLSSSDVRQAAQLAVQKRGKGTGLERQSIGLVVGLLAFFGGLAAFMYQRGALDGVEIPWVMVGVVGLIVVVGVLAVVRKMGE